MDPRDFDQFFRGFFGLNQPRFPNENNDSDSEDASTRSGRDLFNFQVFTNPLDMHRYFESQMEEVLKNFRGFAGLNSDRYIEGGDWNRVEELSPEKDGDLSDRDMMLKHDDYAHSRKEDSDIDKHNLTVDDLTGLFKTEDGTREVYDPHRSPSDSPSQFPLGSLFGNFGLGGQGFSSQSFSYSRTSRTVMNPDGSVLTEERTRNPDGSETVIVKRREGGKETITEQHIPDPSSQTDLQQPGMSGQRFGGGFGSWLGWGNSKMDEPVALNPPPADSNSLNPPPADSNSLNPHPADSKPLNPPPADSKYSSIFSRFFGN